MFLSSACSRRHRFPAEPSYSSLGGKPCRRWLLVAAACRCRCCWSRGRSSGAVARHLCLISQLAIVTVTFLHIWLQWILGLLLAVVRKPSLMMRTLTPYSCRPSLSAGRLCLFQPPMSTSPLITPEIRPWLLDLWPPLPPRHLPRHKIIRDFCRLPAYLSILSLFSYMALPSFFLNLTTVRLRGPLP